MMMKLPALDSSLIDELRRHLQNKHLLVLGAGIMQVPLISIAHQLGLYVTVVDADETAVGVSLADAFLHIDLKAYDEIAAAAVQLNRSRPLHGVCTVGTDFSTSVAYTAEMLGLPGIPFAAAQKARYKHRMREALAAAGLPTPPFTVVSPDTVEENMQGWKTFPAVVKPVDNMGARGVRIIYSPAEFSDAVQQALENSHSRQCIVEGFISGQEYSIDAVWIHGRLADFGIAIRHIYFDPYRVELGHSFPAPIDSSCRQSLLQGLESASRALGITWGAVKGDVFWDGDKAVIGEVAARLSGGFMSGWTYPLHSGVSAILPMICATVGYQIPPALAEQMHTPRFLRPVAERAIIGLPGVISDVSGIDEAAGIPGVHNIWLTARSGSIIHSLKDNIGKCGNVICSGDTDAAGPTREAVNCIRISMQTGCQDTIEFLTDPEPHAPLIYPLPQEAHIDISSRLAEIFQVPIHLSGKSMLMECEYSDWLGRYLHHHTAMLEAEGLIVFEEPDVIPSNDDYNVSNTTSVAVTRVLSRAGSDGIRYLCETFRGKS